MTAKTKPRRWTDEQLGYVQDTMQLPLREVAEHFGVSCHSISGIRARVRRVGVYAERKPWTDEDDEVVRKYTGTLPAKDIAAMLPGRTTAAVKSRRLKLSLPHAAGGASYNPHAVGLRVLIAKTCLKCGHLMPGSKFPPADRAGYLRTNCSFCQTDRFNSWIDENPEKRAEGRKSQERASKDSEWQRRVNDATKENATRSGYPYLEADFEILEDPTISLLGKALRTERTYHAVKGACSVRKLSSLRPYVSTRDESKWIIDNPNAAHVDEITAELKQEFAAAGVKFPEWDWDD